jgi:group I intron endonuclease
MKKIGIYKIINPLGKIYIGASKDILKRWNVDYKYASNIKSQIKLYHSFKKYGVENHVFEIVEICGLNNLFIKEVYWIEFYNSYKEGLNCTKGGENPPVQNKPKTLEHKLKIGLANKGKKHSEETILKIKKARAIQVFTREQIEKAANKKRGVESKLKGRKRPNISNKLKGRKSNNSIKCELYNKDSKEIVYADSIQALSRASNISVSSILKMRKGIVINKYKQYEYKQYK